MKAVILAAGVGSRLRPQTDELPKSLLKIAGKEILSYQIDSLLEAGIKDLVVVVGHHGKKIKAFLDNYPNAKDFKIKFIENKEYASTKSLGTLLEPA